MFASVALEVPAQLARAHEEIDAIARGADVDPHELRAVNARTEILGGAGTSAA